MRADQALVEQGHALSRTQAQHLIEAGLVYALLPNSSEQKIKKPSQKILDGTTFRIEESEILKYVSRGGLKLEGALKHLGLNVKNLVALDVGISTGGFTDCLLQHGVTRVVGIDVGHEQLASKLKSDPRVVCLEGINARELNAATFESLDENSDFDLIVVDVSFISLTLVLPSLPQLLKSSGKLLALVKPQFEVGAGNLGKGGIVKDNSLYKRVEEKILATCDEVGFKVEDYFESTIEGGDGNKEFFVFATCR